MLQLFFGLLLILLTQSALSAEDLVYSTLKNGVGLRPLSMGNAFTAVGENGEGAFYNPAGIASNGYKFSMEQLDQKNTRYDDFSSVHLFVSPIAISLYQRQLPNQDRVRVQSYSIGNKTTVGLDWGITYKTVQTDTDASRQDGWSSDIGFLAHITPKLDAGLTLKDIISNKVDIPSTWTTGLAYRPFKNSLLLTTDLRYDSISGRETLKSSVGAEAIITEGFALRAGLFENTFSSSISLKLPLGEISYGIISPTNGDDPTYMIAGSVGIGSAKSNLETDRYALFKREAYATFSLNGNLISGQSDVSLLGGKKIGMNDLLKLVQDAKNDKSCKGFIIKLGNISSTITSIGLIQELRQTLIEARDKGKTIWIYLENSASLSEYYLASCATKIIMPELGSLNNLGLELEVTKTKALYKNFGLGTQTIKNGSFKASLNPATDSLSKEERIMLEGLVQSLYRQTITDIQKSRALKWEDIESVFNGRVVGASEAKAKGLIDEIGYFKTLEELAKLKKADPKNDNFTEITYPLYYFEEPASLSSLLHFSNQIAVIEIDGSITNGQNDSNILFGGKSTGADDIEKIVESIKKNSSIQGVIVRINSPGGSGIASDRIYYALKDLKKKLNKKPLYAVMGNLAASGGYYIAVACDKIYANKGTLTGSIGVISQYQNKEVFNKMFGIQKEVIKTGKYVDMGSDHRPLTPEEITMMTEHQTIMYNAFKSKVKESRNLTEEQITTIAQGQLFTGEEAFDLKLVDKLGNFYTAVTDITNDRQFKNPDIIVYRKAPSTFENWLHTIF